MNGSRIYRGNIIKISVCAAHYANNVYNPGLFVEVQEMGPRVIPVDFGFGRLFSAGSNGNACNGYGN